MPELTYEQRHTVTALLKRYVRAIHYARKGDDFYIGIETVAQTQRDIEAYIARSIADAKKFA